MCLTSIFNPAHAGCNSDKEHGSNRFNVPGVVGVHGAPGVHVPGEWRPRRVCSLFACYSSGAPNIGCHFQGTFY